MIQLQVRDGQKVIELGGGANPHVRPNVDVRPCYDAQGNPTVDFTADFDEPLPIQSEEWDGVFSHFVLEHICYRKVPQFISEVYRILKPGGKAVIVTANTEEQIKWILAHPEGWDGRNFFDSASGKLFGDQDYPENAHKNFMSPSVAMELFSKAGFENIAIAPYGERDTDMLVEAVRPASSSQLPVKQESTPQLFPEPQIPLASESTVVLSPVDEYKPQELFDYHYFNGGSRVGGYSPRYWDFPCHYITAQHVLDRHPTSVLELGCARGYVLKRMQNVGIKAHGVDVSEHCRLTQITDGINTFDLCKTPWPLQAELGGLSGVDTRYDLCYSIAVLDHIPERFLPAIVQEMAKKSRRGLHGINFQPQGDGDRTRPSAGKPKEWWVRLFSQYAPGWHVEIVDQSELENGSLPSEVVSGDGKNKLHINCGMNMALQGWSHLDSEDHTQFAAQAGYRFTHHDFRNGVPCGTDVVDLIRVSNLQKLTHVESLALFKECRRIIKKSGVLRVSSLNAKLLTELYLSDSLGSTARKEGLKSLWDLNEYDEVVSKAENTVGKSWALLHLGNAKVAHDVDSLRNLLHSAGFSVETGEHANQITRETLEECSELHVYMNAIPQQ